MRHPFDDAIALQARAGEVHGFDGQTSAGYANMVGPFGGIVAAQMLQAVMQHPQRLGEPVALTVNYASGLADGPFVVRAVPARTNRSTQHWVLEVQQGGEISLTGTALTAVRRETFSLQEHHKPNVPAADAVQRAIPRMPMNWFQRYDMRFIRGVPPPEFDGSDLGDSLSQLWVRDDPPRPLDHPALAAICDVFIIRLFLRRAKRVPVGTVSMTCYFHTDSQQLAQVGADHVLGQAVGQNFRNGYFDQVGQIWSPAGDLLASTHQLVYFRE